VQRGLIRPLQVNLARIRSADIEAIAHGGAAVGFLGGAFVAIGAYDPAVTRVHAGGADIVGRLVALNKV